MCSNHQLNVGGLPFPAETVSAIFPNILGLQFLAQLDGILFELAKKDVLGTHLRRACTAKVRMELSPRLVRE